MHRDLNMAGSNFPFIPKSVLRKNLDESFEHILTLLPFTESKSYNEAAKSAFRKTIIIYTASIVEALVFYVIDTEFSDDDVREYYSTWELKDKKMLHVLDSERKIVAGTYCRVLAKSGKGKMNLGQIIRFLKDKEILDEDLYKKVDQIRVFRNEQHIGTHSNVPIYGKKKLEKAFSIAKDVKEFVRERYE